MTQNLTELEKFIIWFAQLEEIPLQTRTDFIGHILEIGGIDKKAQDFIDETLERLVNIDVQKAQQLQFKINLINSALEAQKLPQISLKEKIVTGIVSWMDEKVQNFKSWFKGKEAKIMKEEEASEQVEDLDEVEKLKAGLIEGL